MDFLVRLCQINQIHEFALVQLEFADRIENDSAQIEQVDSVLWRAANDGFVPASNSGSPNA